LFELIVKDRNQILWQVTNGYFHACKTIRDGIDQEKKGYAENYEQGQVMEKNLISMAREIEKLHSEIANAEKRARAAAAAGTQGTVFLTKIVISLYISSNRLP
jgi:hypothetical protein